ncbi:TIR domain protein [uncultured archaeon]|nr:TIR domain protein [uncultured archaeon]
MDSNIVDIKPIKLFFSYSINDKKIVGLLKKDLKFMGFDVFLAHDDIEPSVEWQEEIIKNLKDCDIFITILTDGFKDSEWTDQETGIAIATDKFIIPLQLDFPPYGFIKKKQSLNNKCTSLLRDADESQVKAAIRCTAIYIVIVINNKSKFGVDMKSFIVNNLIHSENYNQANARASLLDFLADFTPDQVLKIFNGTKENRQIQKAYTAKAELQKFFEKYQGSLTPEKYNEIIKLLNSNSTKNLSKD